MSVEVSGLTKLYGEQKAIDNLQFTVGNGEILGFLGPNGAGKSTTMKILSCFIPPSSGTASVCGFDIRENSLEVRKNIGYLPENNPLYHEMYVKEYLQLAAGLAGFKANRESKINDLIGLTGLDPEKHKKIGTLSKGYKQRVGLAQALLHDPKVLILDEPTSGLDPNQLVEIRALIKELGKDKTILFSTHIMQEVEAVCSRAIIINKGKIVADGDIDSLKSLISSDFAVEVEFLDPLDLTTILPSAVISRIESMGESKYLVFGNDGKAVRKTLAEFALQHGNTIVTLKEIERKLEDVFHELTQKTI